MRDVPVTEEDRHEGTAAGMQPEVDAVAFGLVAYSLPGRLPADIRPAPMHREWMEQTPSRFALRCLPMLLANQAGWIVLNSHAVSVTWSGGNTREGVIVEYEDQGPPSLAPVVSHFGCGIVTWRLPFLFRTSRDFDLLVRGPANMPKPGAYPLEGLVETDWAVATFTMNWKLLHRNETVRFAKGEPVCMIVPQRKGDLARFDPTMRSIETDAELASAYEDWRNGRSEVLVTRRSGEWQKTYFQGRRGSSRVDGHVTKLNVKPFTTAGKDQR
jgi:hypothetical protein